MQVDLSRMRLKPGDRCRDMLGREGNVVALESPVDGLIWEVTVDLDEGGTVKELMGFWEKIPDVRMGA